MKRLFLMLALGLFVSPLLAQTNQDLYEVRITQIKQIDRSTVGVWVAVSDQNGNPIQPTGTARLEMIETNSGSVVVNEELIKGAVSTNVSVALVIDMSGSMKGEKFEAAKSAAAAFVRQSPRNFSFSVVTFSEDLQVVCDFTNEQRNVLETISNLQLSGGGTRLHAAIEETVSNLRTSSGDRLTILALTDGIDDDELLRKVAIQNATSASVTVSAIGLGGDVEESVLREYEKTGGVYRFSPGPSELTAIFQTLQNSLESEYYYEFNGLNDGLRRRLEANLYLGQTKIAGGSGDFASPGFIPHVRGVHGVFAFVITILIFLPAILGIGFGIFNVTLFRNSHLHQLQPSDPEIGQRDRNVGPKGMPFRPGEMIIKCPQCTKPHYVRSWRLNKCKCMQGDGEGHYCYVRHIPPPLRKLLNWLFGSVDEQRGSRFSCRCCGDDDGY